ncbi:hypothetical protein [Rubrobacter aplysinae]|uniref:hypothetical protein n=1 Tax=Rubrobacter aplysinae TaxID=909625 RepID=UPI00128B26F7|nr:hypothetical protein [Rubrobacter aplysinae]
MDRLRTEPPGIEEEREHWESLASACAPPLRRLGSFAAVGFTAFIALMTGVVLFYNLFGPRYIEGQGVMVPPTAFYWTMALGAAISTAGYAVWMALSAHSYSRAARRLEKAGLDPLHPTLGGLRAYPDEQMLALRARYEGLGEGSLKRRFERTFGFEAGDAFELGPLSTLPDTFEMNALRVEWETNLLLAGDLDAASLPDITWWRESRLGLLPRQPDRTSRLLWSRRYTDASVRLLKRRYGYRTDRWHETVPEGKLWDAVRDYEDSRRIHVGLHRR